MAGSVTSFLPLLDPKVVEAAIPKPSIGKRTPDTVPGFRFLDLPAEKRIGIYELALIDHLTDNQPALSTICRQVHSEALDTFYSTHLFTITIPKVHDDVQLTRIISTCFWEVLGNITASTSSRGI